jgi:hypothetical protein
MKFKTLSFTLFALISQHVAAQVLVGPVVGGNYSWTTFADKDLNDTYKTGGVFGFHAGGQLSFRVKKRFFLHTSLIYSTKGRTLKSNFEDQFTFTTKYKFIEMPIVYSIDFKVKTSNSREFKYFLGVGPNISYWLSGNGAITDGTLKENNIDKLEYDIAFKSSDEVQAEDEMVVTDPNRFQLGLNLAAGLVFEPADRQRVMLSVRYEIGHTNLAKSNGTVTQTYFQDPLQSRNQGFRVSLAYLYDLKTSDRNKGKSTIDRRKAN